MGSPTMIYVDPAIAADSGTGTIGDPFGDLQYALNTVTRDATNGDQFNIKAGTDEILAAALSLAAYGTPSVSAPLIFRGYTSAANDGGIGGISGNGSVAIFSSGSFVYAADLHLHNCGSAAIATMNAAASVMINCEINNTSGNGLVNVAVIINCLIHDIGGAGISGSQMMFNNFLKNSTKSFTNAIVFSTGIATGNIIKIGGSSNGIVCTASNGTETRLMNNSIWSNGGTGTGITMNNSNRSVAIINNIIEGFSGSGGRGILTTSGETFLYGHNKFYNNATNEAIGDVHINLSNNDTLAASPFTDPANDDFSVSAAVKAGAYPSSFYGSNTGQYLDVGAAQRMEFTARARYLMGIG